MIVRWRAEASWPGRSSPAGSEGSQPANRLEALKHERKGQHSIRINDQWRVCFVWTSAGPEQVEIVDYR